MTYTNWTSVLWSLIYNILIVSLPSPMQWQQYKLNLYILSRLATTNCLKVWMSKSLEYRDSLVCLWNYLYSSVHLESYSFISHKLSYRTIRLSVCYTVDKYSMKTDYVSCMGLKNQENFYKTNL